MFIIMYTHILIRFGEIFLKGKNRGYFERKLIKNIEKVTGHRVHRLRSRFYMDYFENYHLLKRVFGIVSYSLCIKVDKDIDEIFKVALDVACKRKFDDFKIVTNRADKTFPIQSPQINVQVGQFIENESSCQFDFNSKNILEIEINQVAAFVFATREKCFGGLPSGVEGEVALIVENEASVLAGLMFLKRGCKLKLFYGVGGNDVDLALLEAYSVDSMGVVEDLSKFDDLALVSSQNFENYLKYDFSNMVFRPLIAYSKDRIDDELNMLNCL